MNDWAWLFAGAASVATCTLTESELQSSALLRPGCVVSLIWLALWDFATGAALAVILGLQIELEWGLALLVGAAVPWVLQTRPVLDFKVGGVRFAWVDIFGNIHNHLANALDRQLTSERTHWRKRTAEQARGLGIKPRDIERWLLDLTTDLGRLSLADRQRRTGEIRAVMQAREPNARLEGLFRLIDRWHLNRQVGGVMGPNWLPPSAGRNPTLRDRLVRRLSRMRW